MGYQDKIEDRFFLGGDNLRGFADGGVGPATLGNSTVATQEIGGRVYVDAVAPSCTSRCRCRRISGSAALPLSMSARYGVRREIAGPTD